MSRKQRHKHAAEALADCRFDDALEWVAGTVFGDFPTAEDIEARFDDPRRLRLWRCRAEKKWKKWIKTCSLHENDAFFLTREFFNAAGIEPTVPKPGRRGRYRK